MRQLLSTPSGRLRDTALIDDPRLRTVLGILNPAGEETRLVGGAVRNALLGLPPGDIDLATTMTPAEVTRHAKAAKLRLIPTGLAHGTLTLLSGGHPFEVTTLREDVETDGRHAIVRFGRDFALDARRRDFTMNALSLGPDGHIFDTVGGVEDLAQGRVRFIGHAATRIREDVLRILRFFRFHATYGMGPLDAEGLSAATRHRDALTALSRERIRAEFLKILVAPGTIEVLRTMAATRILDGVIEPPADVDRLDRLLSFAPKDSDAMLRLAALALHQVSDIETLRRNLRLTNAETKRLGAAWSAWADCSAQKSGISHTVALASLLFAHGREASRDAICLRYAATAGDVAPWRDALLALNEAPLPRFPFDSADLMGRGLTGPALGAALSRLRDLWAKAGFPDDSADLERLFAEVCGAAGPDHAT